MAKKIISSSGAVVYELSRATFHNSNDSVRAARLGWNALLDIRKNGINGMQTYKMIDRVLDEMNKNGLFDKPGEVLKGPIKGDY